MLVLGVDPGSKVTGIGLVEKKEHELFFIHADTIKTTPERPFMTQFRPQEMALEDVFFAKNVKSALKIGHARGAVLIAAVQCGVKIFEYTPLEIKKSVVGYGRASKEQVRAMTQVILNLRIQPDLDASDALATAICHLNWTRYDH
jgi:crossover junction endodeoxyribonuclease RuvC